MESAMTKNVEAQIRSFFSDYAKILLAISHEDKTAVMKRDGLL
jgi:hypothetical protein